MKYKRKYLFIVGLLTVIFSLHTVNASSFNTHRSLIVKTLPMEFDLAKKVIPVVRVFISQHGHIVMSKVLISL